MTILTEAIIFLELIGKSFAKIVLALTGVLVFFFTVPQSRIVSTFFVSLIAAFSGGILVHLFSVEKVWTDAFAYSVAFAVGLFFFVFLHVFTKFYEFLSQDDELMSTLYSFFRKKAIKLFGSKSDKK